MSDIRFSRISKTFGNGVEAVLDFSLVIPSPTLAVLVGPSGCGKTTVLRLLAGLEDPTSGEIWLGDTRIDALEPRKRDIAMVFQSYALFPHMTVGENLSFGLSLRKTPKQDINTRVEEIAKKLDIAGLLQRKPGELSGGQRQRVALGRAIIREPKVYLFDEPLSSLDAKLRMSMRYMIKKLYNEVRTTTIYVTHDQVEAMTIGELLIVMQGGKIHQVGTPEECYHRPGDTFVASFLGSPPMNLLEAAFDESDGWLSMPGGERYEPKQAYAALLRRHGRRSVIVGIRPEDIKPAQGDEHGGLCMKGAVVLTEPLGYEKLVHISIGGAEVIAKSHSGFAVEAGGAMRISVDDSNVHFFSAETGRAIPEQAGA
ncbi:MAG: ATP-binding cassette domain-containing protein [Chitinivibrionia bacterium]|nr:ATP-binding cassette domain-containing protein [Chitinivibrionia bacterium]